MPHFILCMHAFYVFRNRKKSFKIPKGIRRKSKDRHHNGQQNKEKGQTTIYKALHRKLKIQQQKPL